METNTFKIVNPTLVNLFEKNEKYRKFLTPLDRADFKAKKEELEALYGIDEVKLFNKLVLEEINKKGSVQWQ